MNYSDWGSEGGKDANEKKVGGHGTNKGKCNKIICQMKIFLFNVLSNRTLKEDIHLIKFFYI